MASFAETTQVPFSDIAAFPVELYGRVGMMKQAMYDSNTAKVQAFHDSIAGLDIIKEPQKAYLSEQLSKLRTNLGSLAGADFSKQSVVNQAAAMAGPLSKDPTIQGAVLSTAAYRKGLSDIEKAKKENLFSPSNTWDFQNEANNWLTDGKVDSSFNHQYTPYTDVRKTAAEALKLLHPNITESDIAFNEDGTLNDALIRKKAKDLSPQQIRNALQATFTPNDYKQLDIDGRFKYQGTSPQRLKEVVTAHSQAAVKSFEDKKREIDNTMSTASGATYTSLKEKSDALQAQIDNITNSYSDYHTMIDSGDPQQLEQAKSLFHSNSFLNNYSAAFAYGEHSQTIQNNPVMQMRMEKLRFQQAEEHWQADYKLKLEDQKLKKEEVALKRKEVEGTYGDLTMHVPNQTITQSTVFSAIEAEKKALDVSRQQMESRYGNGDPMWYTKQQELYNQGKYKNISPVMMDHFRTREIQEGNYNSHLFNYKKLVTEAEAGLPLASPISTTPVVVTDGKQSMTFAPEEVANLSAKLQSETGFDLDRLIKEETEGLISSPTWYLGGVGKKLLKTYNGLSPREKFLMNSTFTNLPGSKASGLTGIVKAFQGEEGFNFDAQASNVSSLKGVVAGLGSENKKILKERQKRIEQQLQEHEGLNALQVVSLGNTEKQQTQMKNIVSNYIGELERAGQDIATEGLNSSSEIDDVKATIKKGDVSYSLVVQRGGGLMSDQYAISVSGKGEEGFRQLIPITSIQKNELFGNMESGVSGEFTVATKERLVRTGNGTTNDRGTKNITQALMNPYLKKAHFPNVRLFSVRGDIVTGDSPDNVNAQLYIFNPLTDQWTPSFVSKNMIDHGLLNQVIAHLDDDKIFQLLYDRKPTKAEIDQLEKLSEVK